MQKTLLFFLATSFCAKLHAVYDNTIEPITTITFTQLCDNTYKTCVEKDGIKHIIKSDLAKNTLALEGDEYGFQIPAQTHKFVDWEDDEYFGYSYKLHTNEGLIKIRFVMNKTCTLTCREILSYNEERFDALSRILYTKAQLQKIAQDMISLINPQPECTTAQAIQDAKFVNISENILSESLFDITQTPVKTKLNSHAHIYMHIHNYSTQSTTNTPTIITPTSVLRQMVATSTTSCICPTKTITHIEETKPVFHQALTNSIYNEQSKAEQFKTHISAHAIKRAEKTASHYGLATMLLGILGLIASLTMLIPNFGIYGVCALFAIMASCDAYSFHQNQTHEKLIARIST